VYEQTLQDFEVIVVNDGSTRDYRPVLREFEGRIRYESLEVSRGVSAARNHAIQFATGKWVVFLDDDDEWLPGFLEQQSQTLTGIDPNVGFCWCNVYRLIHDERGRTVASSPTQFRDTSREALCSQSITVGAGAGLTVRRTCLEKLGGFDVSMTVGEDTELILRLLANGYMPAINLALGVIVHAHEQERLSREFSEYARLGIYDALIRRYQGYLLTHETVRVRLMIWAATVHYATGNRREGDGLLFDLLWAKPWSSLALRKAGALRALVAKRQLLERFRPSAAT
jgi:glycosyltransferase involved in cell wall biosynthesis